MTNVADLRREYARAGLSENDLAPDPIVQFVAWLSAAAQAGITDPNAMVLATVDDGGRPSVRTVLLKGVDERGFAFYTNLASRKSRELSVNPAAALAFRWDQLERQVTVTGDVSRVDDREADVYFASRSRESRLSAWASPQSAVVADRAELERRLTAVSARFPGDVPRPPHWGGWRVLPDCIEFWQGRPHRLHDRLRYRRDSDDGRWVIERIAP